MIHSREGIKKMSRLHAAVILTGSELMAREVLHMIDTYDLDPEYNEEVTFTKQIKKLH